MKMIFCCLLRKRKQLCENSKLFSQQISRKKNPNFFSIFEIRISRSFRKTFFLHISKIESIRASIFHKKIDLFA